MTLDLPSIRRLARSEGLQEIYFNESARVISFSGGVNEDGDRVRMNVYYTTGTVATALDNAKQGRTQVFHQNVSLVELRSIFSKAHVHTDPGYHRTTPTATTSKNNRRPFQPLITGNNFLIEPARDEETAIRENLLVLHQEAARLAHEQLVVASQIAESQRILDSFEAKRQEKALEEQKERERLEALAIQQAREAVERQKMLKLDQIRTARGKYIEVSVTEAKFVSDSFDETVKCIACGGTSTIMIYESGGLTWSAGLAKNLHNKLQKTLPNPTYVAMGSRDRYYIEFEDGEVEWVGCNKMGKALRKNSSGIASVAFGEDWDSYFIVFKDGWWSYNNIPQELIDVLEKRHRRGDLACVSLGPNGEYYMSALNGRCWWGGMSNKAFVYIGKFRDSITFMDFGDNNSYLFRRK
jgi:hypothetical protein